MERMTKKERVQAAIKFQDVDRLPISMWWHIPHVDQDPINLAEETVRLTEKFDWDFIKMMPFGNYVAQDFGLSVRFFCTNDKPAKEREFGIKDASDYLKLEPLPAIYGTYGKQLQFTQYLQKMLKGNDIPYIQTIFSPLSVAKKLAGPRIYTDIKEHPEEVKHALKVIAETEANFCKANIEAGVAGFFFASQCASSDLMTEEEYKEFGVPYDLELFDSYKDDTWFNVIHIHGDNVFFKLLADYPGTAVNWHDRWTKVSLADARKLTDKCLMGGINEREFMHETPDTIRDHIKFAVDMAGKKGYMITPGCVAKLDTPEINFYAARVAAETF